jgi:hypothetical protein
MTRIDNGGRWRFGAVLLTLSLGVGVAGCNNLLDVDNPNNVVGEDILLPSAAEAVANGALYELQSGYTYMLMVYSTGSDELTWVGSRDAYQQLDFGNVDDPLNEFSDEAFKDFAPARWMADEAIEILSGHYAADSLPDEATLAEAYLWGAINYVVIADVFDDFVFSDKQVAQPPIGEANMGQLYADAIGYLDAALALDVSGDLERNLMAMRARAKHARGVWNLLGTRPISTGLISASDAAAAATDAQAALNLGSGDWTFSFEYISGGTGADVHSNVNSRLEMRFGDRYIVGGAGVKRRDTDLPDRGVALLDPVDNIVDMRLDAFMTPFEDGITLGNLPILSAREMHLILAEDALARSDAAAFAANINVARGWGGLNDWTPASGVSEQDILIHERQVNLYMQMRRLNDMYRFGIQGDMWQAASPAVTAPGTFWPITKAEIDANCHINPDWPSDVPCGG